MRTGGRMTASGRRGTARPKSTILSCPWRTTHRSPGWRKKRKGRRKSLTCLPQLRMN